MNWFSQALKKYGKGNLLFIFYVQGKVRRRVSDSVREFQNSIAPFLDQV
jgi:hypothetical protein